MQVTQTVVASLQVGIACGGDGNHADHCLPKSDLELLRAIPVRLADPIPLLKTGQAYPVSQSISRAVVTEESDRDHFAPFCNGMSKNEGDPSHVYCNIARLDRLPTIVARTFFLHLCQAGIAHGLTQRPLPNLRAHSRRSAWSVWSFFDASVL